MFHGCAQAQAKLARHQHGLPFFIGKLTMLAADVAQFGGLFLREELGRLFILEVTRLALAALPVGNHELVAGLAVPLLYGCGGFHLA